VSSSSANPTGPSTPGPNQTYNPGSNNSSELTDLSRGRPRFGSDAPAPDHRPNMNSNFINVSRSLTRLRGAIHNIKEAIALMLDLPERIEVQVEPEVVTDLKGVFTLARNARIDLDEAQRLATTTLGEAVRVGRSTGLSLRDIAEVTGVTFQRVAQVEQALVRSSTPSPPRI